MNKRNKIIYCIATIWLALGMASTGIVQLMKIKTGAGGADSITHLGYPPSLLTLLGVAKLLGVIAILIPKFPLLKEWAYAGFFFLMAGAIFSHIESADKLSESLPPLLLVVLTLVSWYFRSTSRKISRANP